MSRVLRMASGCILGASALAACESDMARHEAIPVTVGDSAGIPVYTLSYLPPWNDTSFERGRVNRCVNVSSGDPPLLGEDGLSGLELPTVEHVPEQVGSVELPEPLLRHRQELPDERSGALDLLEPLCRRRA